MRRLNYNDEHWQRVLVKDTNCLFNDMRIDRATIPKGKYIYELADGDSDGIPCRMRPGILVNFFGTIICDKPFIPDDGDTVYLDRKDFCFLE